MGLFGGSQESTAEKPTIYNSIRVQTSSEGVVIPVIFGTNRVTGNLIWSGDFKALAHDNSQGKGMGGGGESTSYTYKASFILSLAEGTIAGIGKAWKGKKNYATLPATLTLKTGTYPQAAWSFLTTSHPTEALPYPGIAYVCAPNFKLGESNDLPAFSFELKGLNILSGTDDADAADVITQIISNVKCGLGLSQSLIDVADFSDWCRASGLLISPAFTEARSAAEAINDILDATFATARLHDGATIQFIPYGDGAESGNGKTWTPALTPVANLNDDDFLEDTSRDPVTVTRKSPAEAYNSARIEYLSRGNAYNPAIVDKHDQGAIDLYLPRPDDVKQMHMICLSTAANKLTQLRLQRGLYVRNEYKFSLGWEHDRLEPMDIVTLTDSGLGLSLYPVRITNIEENEDGARDFTAEDLATGIGSVAAYTTEAGAGGGADHNVDPGNVNTPVIFDAPGRLTLTGHEIWAALSGGANWGGVDVYISTDDTTYQWLFRQMGPSRYGTLSALLASGSDPDTAHTLAVDLTVSAATLLSGTQADADNGVTLCLVDSEMITYQTASLTDVSKYSLTYLRRGFNGSAVASHALGATFIRLDETLVKIPIDASMVGKVLYFKFASVNTFEAGEQDLSSVTAYSHTYGASISYPPSPTWNDGACTFTDDFPVLTWNGVTGPNVVGYEIRQGASWAAGTLVTRQLLGATSYKWTAYPLALGRSATYWIASYDASGNYCLVPDSVVVAKAIPDMSGFTPTPTSKNRALIVNWKAWAGYGQPGVLTYNVHAEDGNASMTATSGNLMKADVKGSKYTIPGLVKGDTYYSRVVPVDQFGAGTASEIC